jgi:hypothetical protein
MNGHWVVISRFFEFLKKFLFRRRRFLFGGIRLEREELKVLR